WTLERVAYRRLRGGPRLAPLISAIGMSVFLQNYVQLAQGARVKAIAPVVPGEFDLYESAGFTVHVCYVQVLVWIVTLTLMVVFALLITRTAFGRAQRSCEQDATMAALAGVDVDRTIARTFVIGAALAAVAG